MQLGEARAILADRMALTCFGVFWPASQRVRSGRGLYLMDALSKNLRYADVLLLDPQGKPALAIGKRFGSPNTFAGLPRARSRTALSCFGTFSATHLSIRSISD